MYLYKKSTDYKQAIMNSLEDKNDYQEVMYWRKDYLIHEWFSHNFDVENCEFVKITKEDLQNLIEYLGEDDLVCEEIEIEEEEIKESIKKLNEIIKETDWENEEIYYYAWW